MKNVIKLITPVVLMLLFAMSSSAQTAATKVKDGKQCDPKACAQKVSEGKNCEPKLCTALTSQCKKGMKTSMAEASSTTADNVTRVAAASAERTPADSTKKPACTSSESKKCCAKKGK